MKCLICNAEFEPKAAHQKYCSPACKKTGRRIRDKKVYERTCPTCGESFTTTVYNKIYCSSRCKRRNDSRKYYTHFAKPKVKKF